MCRQVKEGCHLYALERDTMREMFGAGDGVRLSSQLQKDKQKAEEEGVVTKESAFPVGRREGKKKGRDKESRLVPIMPKNILFLYAQIIYLLFP